MKAPKICCWVSDPLDEQTLFTEKDGLARKSKPQEAELDHSLVYGVSHSSAHQAARLW